MGSKGSQTSTSTVSIPPEVLARYNSVNAQAQQAASQPFQAYSQDPNAFVAPLTSTQQTGIANTNTGATQAQPYYDAATGLTLAGAGPANLGQLNTNQYMSPYLSNVVGTTLAAQQMTNAQQASNLAGQQIQQGAFGGDRAGIGQANLAYQQNMANNQALANELQSGYTQAQNVAQQQQGAQLAAEQANLQRMSQAGQQIAGLGTGAQAATLSGAQAQLAAGQQQQQTQQAGLTALYNQYLQQQGYPFQVAQFLANIAEGTGALSGSTTTSTSPAPFFSDERLKEDVEPIGETYDGQKIVKFRYKGHHGPKQIGLIAQDVERHHPHAVGLAAGFKTVDYDEATKHAAHKGHFAHGGLASEGGGVWPHRALEGFDTGGMAQGGMDPMTYQMMMLRSQQMYGPYAGAGLGKAGYVPPAMSGSANRLMVANPQHPNNPNALQTAQQVTNLVTSGNNLYKDVTGKPTAPTPPKPQTPPQDQSQQDQQDPNKARGGLARGHFDLGGSANDNDSDSAPDGMYKPVGPGLNIPDERNTRQLATAQNPSGGGGGNGLSDLTAGIGLAKSGYDAFKFLSPLIFAANGGLIEGRPHFYTGGSKDQPSDSSPDDNETDYTPMFQSASDETGIPTNLLIAQAKQESQLNPNITGKAGEVGMMQILPSTARKPGLNLDPVDPEDLKDPKNNIMFGARYLKALGDRAGVQDWTDPTQSALALKAYNGGGDKNYVQNVFSHLGNRAIGTGYQQPSMLDKITSGLGKAGNAAGNLLSLNDQGGLSDTQLSLLSGLFGMLASPSHTLLGSIGTGGLTGVKTYEQLRNDLAARQEKGASSALTAPSGYVAQFDPTGKFIGYRLAANVTDYTSRTGLGAPQKAVQGPPAPTGVSPNAPNAPTAPRAPSVVMPEYGQNAYHAKIAPTSDADEPFKQYGLGTTEPVGVASQMAAKLPGYADQYKTDKALADTKLARSANTSQITSDLNNVSSAVNSIDPNSFASAGPGQAERARLIAMYNVLAPKVGLPDKIDPNDKTVDDAYIINKINSLAGPTQAGQQGIHAGYIANAITGALPSGNIPTGAANHILASMYVAKQEDADFKQYQQAYVQKYGTLYGVNNAFEHDMRPIYNRDKALIEKSLAAQKVPLRDSNGTVTGYTRASPLDAIRANPNNAVQFEKQYNAPGLARYALQG